jgi:hypothetical protein
MAMKGRSTMKGVFRNPMDCWNPVFEDYLESIRPGYGQTMLNYYDIKGPIMMVDIPNILTMDDTQLHRLAKLTLDRISKSEILRRGLVFKEADFFTFVETFSIHLDSRLKRKAVANVLRRCIAAKLKYMNIPTGSHDDFILKLAILRAKLLRDLAA